MVVLERDDGNFTFAEQYHYASEHDGQVIAEGWASLPAEGMYATVEDAEAAARLATDRWAQ